MKGERGDQLALFDVGAAPRPRVEPHHDPVDRQLAQRLPAWLRFGTSSWTFPGWAGIVYGGKPTQADLVRSGLAAYAQHPLLSAVGVDRSYYGPLTRDEWATYAGDVPERFRFVSKAWDELTTCVYPKHPRYGARAGQRNPHFLDPARAAEIACDMHESLGPKAGALVFELTPMPPGAIDERTLSRKIEGLVRELPGGLRVAFELRNRELLGERHLATLRAAGAAHVLTYWTAMPPLRAQLAMEGSLGATFTVLRLMLPPFLRYEARKAELAPFDRIVAPEHDMRDDVVLACRRALDRGLGEVFVLVNNKAEGSAPLTIRALAEKVIEAL